MPCYIVNDDKGEMYGVIKGIIPIRDVKVEFGDGVLQEGIVFDTVIIETQFYVPYLMHRLFASRKFKLIDQIFESLGDVLKIPEQHIFNCMGFFSNKIF